MSGPDNYLRKKGRLEKWFEQVCIRHDSVTLFSDSAEYGDESLGVKAMEEIIEGCIIATIPKEAIISMKNSTIGDLLERQWIGGAHRKDAGIEKCW